MLNKDCLQVVMDFVPSDFVCDIELDWAWLPHIEPDRTESLTMRILNADGHRFQLELNISRWSKPEEEDDSEKPLF